MLGRAGAGVALLTAVGAALFGAAVVLLVARITPSGKAVNITPPPTQPTTLATVLNAMLDGVLLLEADSTVSFSNPAARRLLHLDSDDAHDAEPGPCQPLDNRLAGLVEQALSGAAVDTTLDVPDGERLLRCHVAPLNDVQRRAVVVLHDLTELRRLDRVRQEFVANASHELLTPIGTVRALADALARGGLDDKKVARRFLKQLRVEADRLTALARDLVDLAQAQADELQLELKATDVNEVIAVVLERLSARAAKAGVTLNAAWENLPPPVFADAARLEQVLVNLVQNAIKFTPAGGRIDIATLARDTVVNIRVRDTGVGIAASDLPRVFERFYKVRGASAIGGTGLGLAIVRHLMGAMHGEVTVESELGEGSTFTVTLQRADQETATTAVEQVHEAGDVA